MLSLDPHVVFLCPRFDHLSLFYRVFLLVDTPVESFLDLKCSDSIEKWPGTLRKKFCDFFLNSFFYFSLGFELIFLFLINFLPDRVLEIFLKFLMHKNELLSFELIQYFVSNFFIIRVLEIAFQESLVPLFNFFVKIIGLKAFIDLSLQFYLLLNLIRLHFDQLSC
jgi:hypothetical protein